MRIQPNLVPNPNPRTAAGEQKKQEIKNEMYSKMNLSLLQQVNTHGGKKIMQKKK